MDLAGIKARWNEVLDTLLESDRVAWIAFFDARLVSFEDNQFWTDQSEWSDEKGWLVNVRYKP